MRIRIRKAAKEQYLEQSLFTKKINKCTSLLHALSA
jgi:hypothetical protein